MLFINLQKLITNTWKIQIKKEPSHFKYWHVNNLFRWGITQKFPVNNFKWVQATSEFNEDSIKKHNEESDEEYFLEVDVKHPEILHELCNGLPFLPEKWKIKFK